MHCLLRKNIITCLQDYKFDIIYSFSAFCYPFPLSLCLLFLLPFSHAFSSASYAVPLSFGILLLPPLSAFSPTTPSPFARTAAGVEGSEDISQCSTNEKTQWNIQSYNHAHKLSNAGVWLEGGVCTLSRKYFDISNRSKHG